MTGVPHAARRTSSACSSSRTSSTLVVSQDAAVKSVARAIRKARSGLKDPRRPMGCFLFVGPSGVGRPCSRGLTTFMFGDGRPHLPRHVRVHGEAQRLGLIGALGYVGYERQLTERIRRRPYAVVLGRFEKAHPDVFNMLLQIMEEGA